MVQNDTLLKFSLSVKDDKDVPSNIANVTVFVKPLSTNTIQTNAPLSSTSNPTASRLKWSQITIHF